MKLITNNLQIHLLRQTIVNQRILPQKGLKLKTHFFLEIDQHGEWIKNICTVIIQYISKH